MTYKGSFLFALKHKKRSMFYIYNEITNKYTFVSFTRKI